MFVKMGGVRHHLPGCRSRERSTGRTGSYHDVDGPDQRHAQRFRRSNVGEDGACENVSEYIRDLIRRDRERAQREAFERLRAELAHAFAAPDSAYRPLTAAEVIARNRT
jgi:Arc/MetJ-type ribon-helix-helix transcriptional regulator